MDDDCYWKRRPGGPFVTLIRISTTYLRPEADDLESLQELVVSSDRPEIHAFKTELRQAIAHPGQVPGDEFFSHVQYDDGSDEAFLKRLWRGLYGDEPVTATRGPQRRDGVMVQQTGGRASTAPSWRTPHGTGRGKGAFRLRARQGIWR